MPLQARRPLSRRGFLTGAGSVSVAAVLVGTGAIGGESASARPRSLGGYPFTLGVASGDPMPNSVVLWTRLAPDPYAADGRGGMPDRAVPVRWEVAEDERFRRVVQQGRVTAVPELGHSVHPEVWGLSPAREYFYRFYAGGEVSETGRTKTAPAYHDNPAAVSLAFASCANWSDGYFTPYRHLAEEDVDVVLHLGDYIYEYGIPADGGARQQAVPDQFRDEAVTLARYRLQYGLYKSDADLMAAHAAAPWIVTLDDHEVENDWAAENPVDPDDADGFLERRASAFQAYYEHMPLRAAAVPEGPDMQIYRRLPYGKLLDLNVLDTRQYRDDQIGTGPEAPDEGSLDPNRSMLGQAQEAWLLTGMGRSVARWQVLANQAPMAETDMEPGEEVAVFKDPWDGYDANRRRVLEGARDRGVENLVVLTGDRHRHHASDVKADYRDPDAPTMASEFICSSVSSEGDGEDQDDYSRTALEANPHIRFANSRRGYVRCTVTPEAWTTDFRVVPHVSSTGAPISTRATYTVENGRPGVQPHGVGPPV
ncbi:alkaline phosphatase D family protein [Georgenia alba]|uniref:Alkaline phosphatase D family protein n=1 Tax=Georgenia alba TaxID=2233858 RepID=A0ABW2QD10_9MICO